MELSVKMRDLVFNLPPCKEDGRIFQKEKVLQTVWSPLYPLAQCRAQAWLIYLMVAQKA